MAPVKVKLEANGRILLPAEVRKQLGVEPGDSLILEADADGVRIWTVAIAVRRARELINEFVPPGVSLADELIAERRAAAKRFDEKFGLVPKGRRRGPR